MSSNNDPFINGVEKLGKVIQPHFKTIVRISIAIVVVFASVLLWNKYKTQQEIKAQTALFELEKNFEAPELKNNATKEKAVKIDEAEEKERTTKKISALQSFVTEHKGTKASVMAALKASDLLQQQKSSEEALNILNNIGQLKDKNNLIYALYVLKLSQVQANSNQCESAIDELDKIIKNNNFNFLHAEALLKTALCNYSLGKLDQAKGLLNKVKDDYPGSVSARTAERYLRAINIGV